MDKDTEMGTTKALRCYKTPPPTDRPSRQLVENPGTPHEEQYTFYHSIEIGRFHQGDEPTSGVLRVKDPAVSSRHCIITQTLDGRCFVRDVSRNGTWLDGCRLIPNLEVEVQEGQALCIGTGQEFRIAPAPDAGVTAKAMRARSVTMAVPVVTTVTVLVGDIRDYTVLVQKAASMELQQSVSRVFEALAEAVVQHGGTVKEYQGDAIFAFWEGRSNSSQAVEACRAAIALDQLVQKLRSDSSVWSVQPFPLRIDWALATGHVFIDSFGRDRPTGLSMIGEPVVLAFRLEKFANDRTGPIIACRVTKEEASGAFEFEDLGEMHAKGFAKAERVFALCKAKKKD